ncbi:hypothetical protein TEA_001137 [Camellia sinensis var. sinensis]|uniref:non-specific serine/threonine protein kinase n=1 Tax=Camellia sinensis var. sinensis TaxID=542762 RepID=A0A4S4DDH2_CAMSN|nr:hypothetical protein TEA_001137 [Camellia sinensis var. sinensis]
MHPRTLLVLSLLFFLFNSSHPPQVSSENIILDFPSFTLRNPTLLGDAYLQNGLIGLTRDLPVPSSSSGTAIYSYPIPFFDPNSNSTVSFSTRFSFSITSLNPTSFGNGLCFFLSPENRNLGSQGRRLRLVNSSQLTKNKFVAVEFDTRLDSQFNDPNDNHVGLDIESLVSIMTADPKSIDIDLKSGNSITAWIDYKNDHRKLNVFLSYSNLKPEMPLLSVEIDLSHYLKEFMYVGFSASTEGSTELHLIENWRFETSPSGRARNHPHNVSDNSVITPRFQVPNSSSKKHHRGLGLGLGIACPALICLFVVFGWISVRKRRGVSKQSFTTGLVAGSRQFSYRELKIATKGFHSSRIIGHGAFGTVYKAYLVSSATISAVKRSKHSHEGKTEFLAELTIIASLRHKNLVQLQGWCVEKDELLLVYEFMPNGSLDQVLYDQSERGNLLKWVHRYNIAVGLASVLTYLHQECEQQVIHRDIKASNIMLDGKFNARLGDFRLARLMDHGVKSPVSTLTAGTVGYLAPEYLQCGKPAEKTDVFSYGVVVLEVCCGKRPIEREQGTQRMVNLIDFVWGLHSEGKIMEAADVRLKGEFEESEMRKMLLVGLSWANLDSEARPSMRRVFQILNNEAEPVFVPRVKPSLSFSCGLPLRIEDIIVSDGEEV